MIQGQTSARTPRNIEHAVVRFAGDSGDGMQLTGTEFTREAALHGNDLATFPDFPAEIRAPAWNKSAPGARGKPSPRPHIATNPCYRLPSTTPRCHRGAK